MIIFGDGVGVGTRAVLMEEFVVVATALGTEEYATALVAGDVGNDEEAATILGLGEFDVKGDDVAENIVEDVDTFGDGEVGTDLEEAAFLVFGDVGTDDVRGGGATVRGGGGGAAVSWG